MIREQARQRLLPVLVFALAAAYWFPVASVGINLYDEGLRVYAADRILAGARPYRDFFAYYGPGEYYWPALLFQLFGKELLVTRLAGVVVAGLAAVSVFVLSQNARSATSWALIGVVGFLVPITKGQDLHLYGPAFALGLAGGAIVTGSVRPGRRRLFVAGMLFGSAAVFRPDFGVYGALAGALAFFVMSSLDPSGVRGLATLRRTGAGLVFLSFGVAIVVVPAYGICALDGLRRLVQLLIVFPPTVLPYRALAYDQYPRTVYGAIRGALTGGHLGTLARSTVEAATLGAPLVFVLALVGTLSLRRLRSRIVAAPSRAATLAFVVVFALGLSAYALIRLDFPHVVTLYAVSVCGLAILVGSALDRPRATAAAVAGWGVAWIFALALIGMFWVNIVRRAVYVPLAIERVAGMRVPETAELTRIVADIAAAPGERILIACHRHDRVHTNPVMIYFLSGRPSATYLHDYLPNVTATRAGQERIVRDLRESRTQTVLVFECLLPEEPNLSSRSSGVTILDEFLSAEFTTRAERPLYTVRVKSAIGSPLRRE